MIIINKIKASIKFNTSYECRKCGKIRIGSTDSAELIAFSSEQLKQQIDMLSAFANNMPIGWSAFGVDGFECNHCKAKNERIFPNYYHDRNGNCSPVLFIFKGLWQGNILGVWLFNKYCNNLYDEVTS